MIIKKLLKEHIPAMIEIENSNFKDPWDYKILINEIENNEHALYFGAFINELLIGYIGVWYVVDYFDIANLAIKDEFKKQGVATKLLEVIDEMAVELSVGNVFLEVNVHNESAISLYIKNGYRIVRVIKNYYSQLNEDAYLMQKEFKYE